MTDSPAIEPIDGRFRVRGPVTLAHAQLLLDQSKQMSSGAEVRIDLSGVREADSAAVALMLGWVREAAARGASIRFENLTENLKTLIRLYDVGEFLPGV